MALTKVWVALTGYYNDKSVKGVFSTREKAEQWEKEAGDDGPRFKEFELDKAEVYKNGDFIIKQY